MSDVARILAAFREDLIAAGLGRRPSTAGDPEGNPYPFVIEPRDGAPAPGELSDEDFDHAELVVSLFHGGDLAEATGYDAAQRRRATIDVRYRSADNAAMREAMALDAAIRARLFTPARNYGYGFVLGGPESPVWVHQAALWGGLGPLGRGREVAYDQVAKYLFEVDP